jgi:hypothetical protein
MNKLIHKAIESPIATLMVFSVTLTLIGCGGDEKEKPETTVTTKTNVGGSGSNNTDNSNTAADKASRQVYGIPWDVYKDVYFDNPLKVASDQGSVPTIPAPDQGTADTQGPETVATQPEDPKPEPTGGAVSWDKVISAEMLNSEFKTLRNQFKQRLTTLASYNSSYLELPIFGMSLAVLAEIGRQHPGDLRWKENAKYIRVLGVEIADTCGGAQARGRKSYDKVNKAFLAISDILDGNTPPGLPDADDETPFADFADMGYMMKRFKLSMDWMQNNTGSEDSFKDNAESAQREVTVIAAFAHIFSIDSLGYAEDDPVFSNHAKTMRDNAIKMFEAAGNKNFSDYDMLRSKVNQECTTCHMAYKNG